MLNIEGTADNIEVTYSIICDRWKAAFGFCFPNNLAYEEARFSIFVVGAGNH
jgi:hypothetical protein